MALYSTILHATDLSKSSYSVAEKAAELAKSFGAELTLIHTIEPIPAYGFPGVTELESPLIEQAKTEIQKLGALIGVDEAHQKIEFGSVKAQVIAMADTIKADLIIVGSHGHHGLSRLLGSSASAIVHGASLDVFVIRCDD